ncbi:MAG: hypothetical protein V4673_11595 [Pseudomonadota bacterium]
MKIHGAIVKEQGVSFAIAVVKKEAVSTNSKAANIRIGLQRFFPGLPLILASQDSHGRFEYQGRKDIVRFLASITADRIPWKEYSFH